MWTGRIRTCEQLSLCSQIDIIQLVIMAPDQSEVAPVHHAIIFFIPNSIFCFLLFKVFMKPNIVKQPMKYWKKDTSGQPNT